jgi:hypothetical protein
MESTLAQTNRIYFNNRSYQRPEDGKYPQGWVDREWLADIQLDTRKLGDYADLHTYLLERINEEHRTTNQWTIMKASIIWDGAPMKYGKGFMRSILLETGNLKDGKAETVGTADDYVSTYLFRIDHYETKPRDILRVYYEKREEEVEMKDA